MKMYRFIVFPALFIFFIVLHIKYIENRGIFYPSREIGFTPASINLGFEDVYLLSDDGIRINGWFIPHPQATYSVIFFHGNAGNIADRLEKIRLLNALRLNIFIIDYRGFGRSEGRPSGQGLYLDAKGAYNYLVHTRKIAAGQIILYGESLGTAVAVNLASAVQVKALILEGAFSSGNDMAKVIYPFIPRFFFGNKFNSLDKIKKISCPKLFLHSPNDEVVPVRLARKLYSLALPPKSFAEINGGHNTAFLDSQEKYLSAIISFLDSF